MGRFRVLVVELAKLAEHLATEPLRIDMDSMINLHHRFGTKAQIEKILDERQTEEGGATEYLVRYAGFGETDDLWQSAKTLLVN